MINFTYYNPTKIYFGKDTHKEIGNYILPYGKRVLTICYNEAFLSDSGIGKAVAESFDKSGITQFLLTGVKPNPRLDLVYEGIKICRNEKVDFILSIGGGSVIDTAKAIASGINYEGDVWDFFTGKAVIDSAIPSGVILTIPAAGSETSDGTVITNSETSQKLVTSSDWIRPVFAVMNPELTYSLPAYQTACGIADMFSHIIERYFAQERHVDLSDKLCEANLVSIIHNAPKVLANPDNYDYRAEIMWAGTVGNNTLENMGRTACWGAHLIQHQLGAEYDIAHGAGLCIVTPAWMRYVYKAHLGKFVQFAVKVMGVQSSFDNFEAVALEGIERLEQFLKSIGMPTRLSEAGITGADYSKMAASVCINGPIGHFVELNADDVAKIYKLAE